MAAVPVPVLECGATFQLTRGNGLSPKTEQFKKVAISLNRNEFEEIVLKVDVLTGKDNTRVRNVPLYHSDIEIHRKFVKEGKLTINFKETSTKLLLWNAPPKDLVIFVKALAAKLASTKDRPKVSVRKKLTSEMAAFTEGISPVTVKDVKNMQMAEAGGRGLLRMRGYTPKQGSPLAASGLKRKLCDESKENKDSVNGGGGPTPKRQTMLARRPLREAHATVVTSEQRYVLEMVKSGKNVFITGGAGTGKSFLIQKIIGILPPHHTAITASTGVAAFLVGGTTLHSFAGIGSGSATISKCIELARRKTVAAQWRKCSHLIIDEISMVDGNYFKKLEAVAKAVKGNDKPFGGIQLILTGDFLQLPPVTKGDQVRRFAFETSAWRRCVQINIELKQVKRQSDPRLVNILHNLRMGVCGDNETMILAKTKKNSLAKDGVVPTKLCTHTEDVNMINIKELNKLSGEEKVYSAADSDPGLVSHINSYTPVDQVLRLRVGAQVMLMKNLNVGQGLVNGARGAVESFSSSGYPIVKFIGGCKEEIKMEKWLVKTGGGMQVSRMQLPLRLAWAFSIHKSQGMTLDCVEVSLARVFECGQAYVALSRAKNLESLRILDFRPGCVKADAKVLKFYKDLQCSKPLMQQKIDFPRASDDQS